MGLFDRVTGIFKKEEVVVPTMDTMAVGFMLTYDFRDWLVKDVNQYEFNEKPVTEFTVRSSGGAVKHIESHGYVEPSYYKVYEARTIATVITETGIEFRVELSEDRVPQQIDLGGKIYHYQTTGSGSCNDDEFLFWEFITEDEQEFIRFEQWSETEFTCSSGVFCLINEFEVIGDSS